MIYSTANDLIASWLGEVLRDGARVPSVVQAESKASDFGKGNRDYLELLCSTKVLISPTQGYGSIARRYVHIPYLFAQMIWSLDARDDVQTLAHYRDAASDFSDDGTTLCGAFGRRLFGAHRDGQLSRIAELASSDPASRRLYSVILDPQDDARTTKEYPCSVGVQFFVRRGALETVVNMRAQQLLTVLPYDLFFFAVIALFMATRLGVAPGALHYQANTAHIYASEVEAAIAVSSSPVASPAVPRLTFSAGEENWYVSNLALLERSLRLASDPDQVASLALPRPEDDEFTAVSRYVLSRHAASRLLFEYEVQPGPQVSKEWVSEYELFEDARAQKKA